MCGGSGARASRLTRLYARRSMRLRAWTSLSDDGVRVCGWRTTELRCDTDDSDVV